MPGSTSGPESLSPARLKGRRILLVADDSAALQWVGDELKAVGATVSFADDAHIGITKVLATLEASRPFDLVMISMQQMKHFDGFGVTRRLRERGYRGPILGRSTFEAVADVDECLGAGCNRLIHSSADGPELIKVVEQLLQTGQADELGFESIAKDGLPEQESIDRFQELLSKLLQELIVAVGAGDLATLEDLIGHVKRSAASEGHVPIIRRAAEFEQQLQRTDLELNSLRRAVRELTSLCDQATTSPGDQT